MKSELNGRKDTDIGTIPAEWDVVPLRAVTQKTYQRDPRKKPEEKFRYIDVSSVSNDRFVIQGWNDVVGQDAPSRARKAVKAGDTIFATVRPYLRNIAQVPIHLDDAICSTGFCVIRANPKKADPDFLYFASLTEVFIERIVAKQRGSSYPAVSDKVVLGERIPLPPLDEQRRIAAVLTTIQQTIAAQEQVIQAAREVKRSLMYRLFTYGPYPELYLTKETNFGNVPENWAIQPLKNCAYVQTGAAKGRKFGNNPTMEVPYLRVANVQDGYLDLQEIKKIRIKESELDRYRLQDGDVVLTEGGDFDKLGRGFIWRGQIKPCIHQNHVFAVRTDREKLSPEFLAYLAQSDYGKRYFLKVAHRTTNLASINSTKLKAMPVLLPLPDEQGEITTKLKQIDKKIGIEESRKNALEALFKSTLHQLMTGQIRVPELRGKIGNSGK